MGLGFRVLGLGFGELFQNKGTFKGVIGLCRGI